VGTVVRCEGQSGTDTGYIATYTQKFTVQAHLASYSIELEHDKKTYQPNVPMNPGLGISIQNTIISIGSDFGSIPLRDGRYGSTSVFDFQSHTYERRFILDLFFQRYKGFYYEDLTNKTVTLFPALYVLQAGAELSYVFNGRKFSARAAFDQSELQLRSQGSFVVGGGAYYYKLSLPKELSDSNGLDAAKNFQMGVNVGYAYSWVINPRWLLSGMATIGMNVGNELESLKKGNLRDYPAAFSRISSSYHRSDWAIALTGLISNKSLYTEQDQNFSLSAITFSLTFLKHFDRVFPKREAATAR
jgi:hypothetical protein